MREVITLNDDDAVAKDVGAPRFGKMRNVVEARVHFCELHVVQTVTKQQRFDLGSFRAPYTLQRL